MDQKPLKVREALLVILDCIDYTRGACSLNEMVGAVLPKEIIELARQSLTNDIREEK